MWKLFHTKTVNRVAGILHVKTKGGSIRINNEGSVEQKNKNPIECMLEGNITFPKIAF